MTMSLACVAGIAQSVVLPILRVALPKAIRGFDRSALQAAAQPYMATGLFSALAAVGVIAAARAVSAQWTWQDALIAGYLWDSTFQKFSTS